MRRFLPNSFLSCAKALFLVLAFSIAACGQGAELHIKVTFENGRSVPQGYRVSLMSSVGNVIGQTYTDDKGEVRFSVGPGDYRAQVTSPEIETYLTPGTFEVQAHEQGHFEYVQVKRRPVDSGAARGPFPSVSAAQLAVPDKALEEFKKGTAALDQNDLDNAQKHFQEAVAIFPKYSGAYSNLGIIALQQGDAVKAKSYFEQAVEADPSDADSALNLSRLLFREKSYKSIEELLGKVSGAHPENGEVLMLLAQAQLLDEQPQLALTNAQRVYALPDHQRFSAGHIIAGTALQKLNRPREALQEYELFLKESPDAPAAAQVRAAVNALKSKSKTD